MRAAILFALLAVANAYQFRGEGTAYSGAPMDRARPQRAAAAPPSSRSIFNGQCGDCVRVRGTESGASGKSFLVKIVDMCPTCSHGDIDFSTAALEAITGRSWDRKNIEWEWSSCDARSDSEEEEEEESGSDSPSDEESKRDGSEEEESQDGSEEDKGSEEGGSSDDDSSNDNSREDIECEDGRKVCSDDKLLSDGYICMNRAETKCCKKPNGKDCTPVDSRRRMQRRLLR
ncbi:hypothetical protein ABPG75_003701 [Micractinium tetrahymenae]